MNPLTVIIPSRNAVNLRACVDAVAQHEPDVRIVVVNDGLDQHPAIIHPISYVPGKKPFVFARNCNLGIEAAGEGSDVVLLNDDAILESPGGFTAMQRVAENFPASIGIVSATTNVCNNPQQYRTEGGGLRVASRSPGLSCPAVAFVCVLIPGRTLEKVGLLDERFTAYGWEDNDYCRRVHEAGYSIGIFDGCFVDHAKLTSTFRGGPRTPGDIEAGRNIYLEKWGTM